MSILPGLSNDRIHATSATERVANPLVFEVVNRGRRIYMHSANRVYAFLFHEAETGPSHDGKVK